MSITRRSGSGNGTGFSSTVLTIEKIAVLAPIPSVSAAIAVRVKLGFFTNIRIECFTSLRKASMEDSLWSAVLELYDEDNRRKVPVKIKSRPDQPAYFPSLGNLFISLGGRRPAPQRPIPDGRGSVANDGADFPN